MTEYEDGLPVEVAFGPEEARSLAEAFSEAGWTQFHVAETEKYAHVTYFFNGGVEAPWPGEERAARAEPAGRDLRPPAGDERGGRDRRAGRGDRVPGDYDFIVANFANPDMVGHTGVWAATVDGARGARRRASAGSSTRSPTSRRPIPTGPGAVLLVTADHGNADDMLDADGNPVTKHSLNPVPAARHGPGARGPDAAGRRPRRRRAHDPRARRAADVGGDDRPVAARRRVMLRATDDHRRARIARRHGLHPDHRYDTIEAATTGMTALARDRAVDAVPVPPRPDATTSPSRMSRLPCTTSARSSGRWRCDGRCGSSPATCCRPSWAAPDGGSPTRSDACSPRRRPTSSVAPTAPTGSPTHRTRVVEHLADREASSAPVPRGAP